MSHDVVDNVIKIYLGWLKSHQHMSQAHELRKI